MTQQDEQLYKILQRVAETAYCDGADMGYPRDLKPLTPVEAEEVIALRFISKASVREDIDSMYNPSVSDIYQKEREEYDTEVVYIKDLKKVLSLSEEGNKDAT